MIGVRVANAPEFKQSIDAWIAGVKSDIGRVIFKIVYDAQQYAMSKSPIFSGDFGSNWNISVGTPDFTFVEYPTSEPRTSLWGEGNVNLGGYALGKTVFMANAAKHGGDAYAWKIESGQIAFRDWNVSRDRTDRVLGKTHRYLAEKYKVIRRDMLV